MKESEAGGGASCTHPLIMTRPLETAWANHSEKLHGPPYEREAATPQSSTDTCNIHSPVTPKVQTRAGGSAEERFVQAVRLASCDLNVKPGSGQAGPRVDRDEKLL